MFLVFYCSLLCKVPLLTSLLLYSLRCTPLYSMCSVLTHYLASPFETLRESTWLCCQLWHKTQVFPPSDNKLHMCDVALHLLTGNFLINYPSLSPEQNPSPPSVLSFVKVCFLRIRTWEKEREGESKLSQYVIHKLLCVFITFDTNDDTCPIHVCFLLSIWSVTCWTNISSKFALLGSTSFLLWQVCTSSSGSGLSLPLSFYPSFFLSLISSFCPHYFVFNL